MSWIERGLKRGEGGQRQLLACALAMAALALTFAGAQIVCGYRTLPNLLIYVGGCAAFALVYALVDLLLPRGDGSAARAWGWLLPLLGLGLVLALYLGANRPLNTWAQDLRELPWHQQGMEQWLPVVLAAAGAVGCWGYTKCRDRAAVRWQSAAYALYALLIAGACAWLCYQPLLGTEHEAYHFEAYAVGIRSVYEGIPLTGATAGIYGKYGLFFAPALHLLGGCSVHNITAVAAATGALAALLWLYAVGRLTRHPVIRLLSPLALLWLFATFALAYYQGIPNRLVVPALFSALLAAPHKGKVWRVGMELAGVFALLWSTDSGAIAMVALAAYRVLRTMEREPKRGLIKAAACSLLWAFAQVLGALLIVNLYNLCVGGPLVGKAFFFPVGYSSYDISQSLFPQGEAGYFSLGYPYFWVIAGLLTVLLGGLMTLLKRLRKQGQMDGQAELLAMALLSLGMMTYYMNRPTYGNLLQCALPMLTVLVMLTRVAGRQDDSALTLGRRRLAAVLLSVLACFGAISGVTRLSQRIQPTMQPEYTEAAGQLCGQATPNAYAFGQYAGLLYGELGWNTQCGIDAIHCPLLPEVDAAILTSLERQDEVVLFTGQNWMYERVSAYMAEHFERVAHGESDWARGTTSCAWDVYRRRPD